jgi:hypothetical protein
MNRNRFWVSLAAAICLSSLPSAIPAASASVPVMVKPKAVSAPKPTDCTTDIPTRKIKATILNAEDEGIRRRVDFKFQIINDTASNNDFQVSGFSGKPYKSGMISEEVASTTDRDGGIDVCGTDTTWDSTNTPNDSARLIAMVSTRDVEPTDLFPGVVAKDKDTDLVWFEDMGKNYGEFAALNTPLERTITVGSADIWGQIKLRDRSNTVRNADRVLAQLFRVLPFGSSTMSQHYGTVPLRNGYFAFGNLPPGSYQMRISDNPCGTFLDVPCTDYFLATQWVGFEITETNSIRTVTAGTGMTRDLSTNAMTIEMQAANFNGTVVSSLPTLDVTSIEYSAATPETYDWPVAIITTSTPAAVNQYGGVDLQGLPTDLAGLTGPAWVAQVFDDYTFSVWVKVSDQPAPVRTVTGVTAKLLGNSTVRLCGNSYESTNWTGAFRATIPDGPCSVRISAPQGDPQSVETTFAVVMNSDGTFTVNGGAPQAKFSQFSFTLSSGNFPIRLSDANGNPVVSSYISRQPYSTSIPNCNNCRGWDWSQQTGGQTSAGGALGMVFPDGTDKIYQLNIQPPFLGTNSYVQTQVVLRVSAADGVISKVQKCNSVFDQQAGTCSSWVDMSPVSGRYDFVIRGANVSGRLLTPTGENVAGTAYINVNKLGPVSWSSQSGKGWSWASAGPSKIGGTFGISIDSEGSYWISAQAPFGESFPGLNAYVKVTGSGSSLQFYSCSGYDEPSGELTGCQTTAFTASAMVLQYPVPDLVGTVVNADNSTPLNGWVNVGVVNPGSCATCVSQWLSGASMNSGRFSLSFRDAGTYLLQINPAQNDTSGSVLSNFSATVAISGGVKTVTVAGDSDGAVTLQMKGANFRALIKGGSTAAKFAQVEVMKSLNGGWQWETWANADSNGKVSLNLGDGKYKISPRPPSDLASTYAAVTVFAFLSTSGGTTTTYLTATESCAVAQRAQNCVETSNTDGVYNIALGTPNVSGYVATTAEVERSTGGAPSNTANSLANAWIEAQKYNVMNQNYEWTPLVNGSQANFEGAFAFNLPEGRWRLAVNVPPTANTAGLAKKSFDFTVASNGTVTCDVDYEFCDAGDSPTSGRFDLHLAAANLSGTVTASTAGVAAAEVRAEKWNGNYWQWANLYTQASQATLTAGAYAMNLDATGVYKITAQIAQWRPNTGFSANSIYVYRDTNKVCLLANEEDAKSASSCSSGNPELTGADIALIGASIKGVVRDMDNVLVGNSWVNVARFNSEQNYWQWEGGSPLNSLGQFNLTLKSTLGNTDATPERYRLEIYPPWNSSDLVKKTVTLWVGNFDQSNSEHEFVECANEDFADCPASTYSRRAAGSTLNVGMDQGNIFGLITGPSQESAQGPYINIEKWSVPSWSSSFMWNWTQMHANANNEGRYRLDTQTECPSGCFLRLTANPASWSNTNNWTRNTKIIHVSTDGRTWSSATQSSATETPVSANSYSSGSLDIALRGSNVTGVLKNNLVVVPNAWISLLRQETGGWYSYIDGTSSNGNGTFGLSTEISGGGRYRLEVNPPWNSGLVRFTKDIVTTVDDANPDSFKVCANSTENTEDCNGSSTDFTLDYPQPNAVIKVCRKDASGTNCTGNKAVMNSWVTIYNNTNGNWITGSNTDVNGTVRFNLPNGSYRAEAMPPWNSLDGTRVEFTFTVASDSVVDPTVATPIISVDSAENPKHIVVKLGSPNVTGFVKYRPNTTPVAMQNAWVNVRTAAGSYLPGASTNSSGKFELTLADGDYILTAFPNWNIAQRQQIDVAITVEGNSITTTDNDITWDGVIDFDAVAPNIDFVLEDIGLTPRQVFVQKLDNGSYFTVLVTASEPDITANTGRSAIKLLLPNGTYKMTIQKSAGDFVNGESCRQSGAFEVEAGQLVSNTAINSWRQGFDAINDVLACK